MKKKLMAILLTAVMVMSMASSAFAATDENEIPGVVAGQIESTVDWYATQTFNNLAPASPEQIVSSYYASFLAASSGDKCESVTKLLDQFVGAVEDDLAAHGNKLYTYDGKKAVPADVFTYAGVVATLTAAGKDPKNIGGVDLVALFSAQMSTEWQYGPWVDEDSGKSPYSLSLVLAVLKKYKNDITNADNIRNAVIEICNGSNIYTQYYFPNGKDGNYYIATPETKNSLATSVNNILNETAFAGLHKGTVDSSGTRTEDGDYYIDSNGWYHIETDTTKTTGNKTADQIKAQLETGLKEGKSIALENDGMLGLGKYLITPYHIEGSGIYYYEFSGDNDAKFVEFLAGESSASQVVSSLLTNIKTKYTNDDGTVCYAKQYGGSANTTGLALAAHSIVGDKASAEKTFSGIKTYLNAETGAFQTANWTTGAMQDDLMATKDALEGLISYYRLLAGEDNIWSLKQIELFKGADEEKYDIVKTGDAGEKIQYKHGSGKGLTVKSNADLSKFVAVRVDDKVVPMKYVQLEEGSTVVTIASEYLDALDAGPHTVTIQSTDGFATASFTVTGAAPNTGDTNMILLFAALAIISGMGLAVYGKKRYMR